MKKYMHLCANINLSPHSLHIVFFIVYRHKNGNCTGIYTKQAHLSLSCNTSHCAHCQAVRLYSRYSVSLTAHTRTHARTHARTHTHTAGGTKGACSLLKLRCPRYRVLNSTKLSAKANTQLHFPVAYRQNIDFGIPPTLTSLCFH